MYIIILRSVPALDCGPDLMASVAIISVCIAR